MPQEHLRIVREQVENMLSVGIITPAKSTWSFPVVLASKNEGPCQFLRWLQKFEQENWGRLLADTKDPKDLWWLLGGRCVHDSWSSLWILSDIDVQLLQGNDDILFSIWDVSVQVYAISADERAVNFSAVDGQGPGGVAFAPVYLNDVIIFSQFVEEQK